MPAVRNHTPEGMPLVATAKSYAMAAHTFTSIDYSNKRTWWFGSNRKTGVALTQGADNVTFTSPDPQWINVNEITLGRSSSSIYDHTLYSIRVYRNGVDITNLEYGYENGSTAENTAGGDPNAFVVDYTTGTVIFDNSQDGQTITADYSAPDQGNFQLSPPEGKKWLMHHVEVQFSAPHESWANPMEFIGGVNNSLTGFTDIDFDVRQYNGIRDILNIANIGNIVPSSGGLTKEIYQIPFNYISGITILPRGEDIPQDAENTVNYIDLRLKYNLKLEDLEIATASFYVIERGLNE